MKNWKSEEKTYFDGQVLYLTCMLHLKGRFMPPRVGEVVGVDRVHVAENSHTYFSFI